MYCNSYTLLQFITHLHYDTLKLQNIISRRREREREIERERVGDFNFNYSVHTTKPQSAHKKKEKKKEKKDSSQITTIMYRTRGDRTDLEGVIGYAADMIAKCVLVGDWVGRDTDIGEEVYEIHD